MTPTVVVLAAGSSERMGRPKMLLPYGSATILESTLSAIDDSAAADVVASARNFSQSREDRSRVFAGTRCIDERDCVIGHLERR